MRLILNCNNNFNLFCKIRIFLFIKILLLELFFSFCGIEALLTNEVFLDKAK